MPPERWGTRTIPRSENFLSPVKLRVNTQGNTRRRTSVDLWSGVWPIPMPTGVPAPF